MGLDTDALKTLLTILAAAGVSRYTCPEYTVEFAPPAPPPPRPVGSMLASDAARADAPKDGYSELFGGQPPRLGLAK